MKIKRIIASMFIVSISLWGNHAFATTINFDNVADGAMIDNQYSAQGVTFFAFQGSGATNDGHVYARKDSYAKSQPNSIGLGNGIFPYANDFYGYIDAHFTQLQSSVSVDVAAIVIAEIATNATLPPYLAAYGAKDSTTGKNPLLQIVYYPQSIVKGLGATQAGPWQTLTITRPTNDIQFVILSSPNVQPAAYGEFDNLTFLTTTNTAPSIISNPANINRLQGLTATLDVVAQGTAPLQYQWYKDNTLLSNGPRLCMAVNCHAISGATTSELKIIGLRPVDSGSYYVVVKNQFGSTTSNHAVVSVFSFEFPRYPPKSILK